MTLDFMMPAADTETTRTCSCCCVQRPYSEFYKDGKNADGTTKYRRDCKECYVVQRRKNEKVQAMPRPKRRK